MIAIRKQAAAYHVKRSAVKNTHEAKRGIAKSKKSKPAITKKLEFFL